MQVPGPEPKSSTCFGLKSGSLAASSLKMVLAAA
jgi:hypothetical protein